MFEVTTLTMHMMTGRTHASLGEVFPLQREADNPEDKFAFAVKRRSVFVSHLPFNLAPVISAFLRRDVNKGLMEVTGAKINRGAGYGLEIPCTYHFYGSKFY